MPSTRISVLNMFPFLREAGFEPQVVFDPLRATEAPDVSGGASDLQKAGFDIVYFQKVRGPSVVRLARQLSSAGIKTVYGVCDFVDVEMVDTTDQTIVVTDYLKSLYPESQRRKIHVVLDGIEHPEIRKTEWQTHRGSRGRPFTPVLVTAIALDRLPLIGTPPDWLKVSIIGRYPEKDSVLSSLRRTRRKLTEQPSSIERLRYLHFISHGRIRRFSWDPVGVYKAMQNADIGIIPIETSPEHPPDLPVPSWKVRSENRLTMKMGIGLPVVATPIPAYEQVIEQGKNGFLAKSKSEWLECLAALRDPGYRQSMGARARESVLERYSMEKQASALIEALRNVLKSSPELGQEIETT